MATTYHSITALEKARILQGPESIDDLDFMRGAAIAGGPQSPWVFDVEIGAGQPPHLLGSRIPIASDTLLTVLRGAGIDNIQTFPTVLRLAEGAWRQHSVFNVIGLVDAAVPSSGGGRRTEGAGEAMSVGVDFALSRNATRGLSLFRLFHDPAMLVVNGRVMRALNRHRPPQGWGFSAFEIELSDA